jgi:flagellar protein FlgJ
MKLEPLQLNSALISQATIPQAPAKGMDMQRIEETAQDFEAMFISEMMKPIFESVKVDENFGGGKGEEIFRSFIRDEYAKTMASAQSFGIAEQVKEQLIEMQTQIDNPALARNMHGTSKELSGE